MSSDLFWIPGTWKGRLAIASRPRGGDWLEDEIRGWHEAGIDVLVSLLEPDEAAPLELTGESDAANSAGVQFIGFPIPDRGVPASKVDAVGVLRTIVALLEQGKNVAVHCRQGIGRSGLIASGTMVISGISVERALKTVSDARGLEVPETPGQLQWVRQLPSEQLVAG